LYNERIYLAANPDVADAVNRRLFTSGKAHFQHFGNKEGRIANVNQFILDQSRQLSLLRQNAVEKDVEIAELRNMIDLLHRSASWRWTKPLRMLWQLFGLEQAVTQVRLVRDQGPVTRLQLVFGMLAKGAFDRSIGYVNMRPALRIRLFKLAKKIGVVNLLVGLQTRMQAFGVGEAHQLPQNAFSSYPIWSAHFDTPRPETIIQLDASTLHCSSVLVIALFDETSEQYAEELAIRLVGSLGQQWQAAFVFDTNCKSATTVRRVRRATHADTRFSFNQIQVETNAEFVVLIQGGALPRSFALRVFADALRGAPDALVAYSDEDQFNGDEPPSKPWFKPEFSPLLIRQGVLLGRMLAFRSHADGAQALCRQFGTPNTDSAALVRDYVLSAGESRVVHIPHVLFHDAIAVQHMAVSWPLPELLPTVSIVIPTRDHWDLLGPCLESLGHTDWPAERLEIIVVDNGSTEPMTMKMMAEAEEKSLIRVIRDDLQFNWSRLNNVAVRQARGELLVFLNNDTEVVDKAWLKKLASHALSPGTGAVGCKLLYPDRTVQHGGVIAGIQGVAGHAHLFIQANEGGYRNIANITHEVSAVTGACLAVTRANFEAVGGFDENFRVAFNDFIFCCALHVLGKRNVYVADPLLIHHESKSRGYDNTPEKHAINQSEARKAWAVHSQLMRDDPFYSPNLSLWAPYELSFAPRRRASWDDWPARPARIMMLSVTHAIGHGVAVVMAIQAEALVRHGYEVIIAGPRSANDFPYLGCDRVEVHDPLSAATLAASRSVDLIIVETPPFFGVARWTGAHPPVLAVDHGEPPPDLFPDANARHALLREKDQSLMMAHTVFAISDAVAAESRTPVHGILPNGNSHLGRWTEATNIRRQLVRAQRGWSEHFVILNVCRFHKGERLYKGVDTYADVRDALSRVDPELSKHATVVLCGKGSPEDVDAMTARGLVVAANVTDEEMADLYCAADAYANFSKWEGYNLGIGQALAMGLPSLASDIPAHRAFGIEVTNSVDAAAQWLAHTAAEAGPREPRIWNWDAPLAQLIVEVDSICANTTSRKSRRVSAGAHPVDETRLASSHPIV
jgi:GT2 family glycosyltransferase